jgi:2-polyprenyl-6-methoxyphenol hydroxylase-like FAD-dependent oxidoreductase
MGEHAVVIGGSMAGLMTARVLADHFEQVTVVERDRIDGQGIHKSIPQGNHYHALLLGGQQVLSSLYPGFVPRLRELGAVRFRVGKEIAFFDSLGKAYTPTGAVREERDLGFDGHSQSRGLIEHCVRELTLALSNVAFESGTAVSGLVWDQRRVKGVHCRGETGTKTYSADLVVDAGGRGTRASRWLRDLGFPEPDETTIGVDFAYASTKFRVPHDYGDPERVLVFFPPAPGSPNGGILGEIEDNTWHVSLAGRFGNYPPADEEGFLAFAKSLYTPRLYDLIRGAKRVADIVPYRFPTSVRRHYERLPDFPEGFLVLGDAICSFNPVYGQGMSSAALQVGELQALLVERGEGSRSLDGVAPAFFSRAAEVAETPWTLAATQDLAYPKTVGERPPGMQQGARYFAALNELAEEDLEVHRLLTEVFHLAKPMSALMQEPLRSRVVRQQERAGAD